MAYKIRDLNMCNCSEECDYPTFYLDLQVKYWECTIVYNFFYLQLALHSSIYINIANLNQNLSCFVPRCIDTLYQCFTLQIIIAYLIQVQICKELQRMLSCCSSVMRYPILVLCYLVACNHHSVSFILFVSCLS